MFRYGRKKVNLHANCDMQNCDGGSSTNAGTADDGTQVVMTGFQVASNLPNVRNWVEIIADGGTYYNCRIKASL